jgi:hypothetical protein
LVSNATAIGPNEKFTLELTSSNIATTIKTAGGYCLSARNGGGIGGGQGDTQTFQTERTVPADDAVPPARTGDQRRVDD